jgi:hypothetical protein
MEQFSVSRLFQFKSMSWEVYDSKLGRSVVQNLTVELFDFIKILAQIINKVSNFWQNEK